MKEVTVYGFELGTKNINSEEFVKRHITSERSKLIYQCITSAIQEYRTEYAKLRIKHTPRTEASIIHDLIKNNVTEAFKDDPNTYTTTVRNLFKLGINNGSVIIRFKKMDKRRRVHNIPTQQSFDFNNQLCLWPSTNINAGYYLNGLEIEVFVACPESNSKNSWVWAIHPDAPQATHEIPVEQLSGTNRRPTPRRKETEEYVTNE